MIGTNFPIADYYREHIIDAETITRRGSWWTAALLIEDPKTKKPFIALYRWQLTESGWKRRKHWKFRKIKEIKSVMDVITRFSARLATEDAT